MDWRRRDSEVQVIPNLCEMNWLGCGTTTTDCHRHGLHNRTAASNTKSATSSTSRRVVKTVMSWTVCIGVRVCDEWSLAPGLWNIIYLVAPGFTLMVCSSVAVVKITIVNWMKYHGCDMHIMLRERERVREWITQSACMRACRVWLLWDRTHVCVGEGCPLLLVTKQHRTARTDVFPDMWQCHNR